MVQNLKFDTFRYDPRKARWVAKNRSNPSFRAETNSSMALGKHVWEVHNDSQVVFINEGYSYFAFCFDFRNVASHIL